MANNLLFLPGAAGDSRFWRPVGELLPGTWRKSYLRWPGLGEQPPEPHVTHIDDLVRLTEEALGDEPTDLLAQSTGGVVAINVALRNPGRVRRLVLAATSGGIDVGAFGAQDWRAEYRQNFPRAADWIMAPPADLTSDLGKVEMPTLLLWGEADVISPPGVGRRLQQLLPRATLRILAKADHGFVQERAGEILPDIEAHLR